MQQELNALADYLEHQKDAIIRRWEDKMRDMQVESTDLAAISREKFIDNMPVFLERFYNGLRDKDTSAKEVGKKHGAQRWEYGLDLRETMKEWNVLHRIIMNFLHQYQDDHGLSAAAMQKAQHLLARNVHDGILYSVKEYDILQQQESEAQFRDLKQTLEESEELTRTHNLRGTSHDLKGIMQNLQMGFFLLQDVTLEERAAEIIDQMSIAADSLEQLLNDLLDLFRLETNREEVNVTEFDAAKALRDLCGSMLPTAEAEDLDLNYDGESPLPVKTDQKKVERIARNLILNALKYTTDGHVDVSWKFASESHWLLEVKDTGPGLASTHAQSLTTNTDSTENLEYTSDSNDNKAPEVQSHGEGIGLLIVRHLCKLLNANIKIDTGPESGTSFEILFPREVSKAELKPRTK